VGLCAAGVALGIALGCGGSGVGNPPAVDPGDPPHSVLAEDELYKPDYGKPALRAALVAERGLAASAERLVDDLAARQPDAPVDDQLRQAVADLAVRRRFIATLEACEAEGRWCPPRLDDPAWTFDPDPPRSSGPADPPMTATLRFDLASWRGLAAELYGRACACRTMACVDGVGVAIDELETRPAAQVQSDEMATGSIASARECLFRLRGKSLTRAVLHAAE